MSAVVFDNVDIVFGDKQAEALSMVDRGATRDEILKSTGVVLGAAGVNLSIEPSEICVLMGLSGSGKSTILRAVNGLNKVARGKVLVSHGDGAIDVAHCTADQLRMLRTSRIAMVFQQFALLPWRTVKENVGFGLELRRMPKEQMDKIVADKLAMVGLTQWAGKFGHELSGGMQQRVGLARAFATDADILLMDEPFSALDPLIRDKLQDELLLLQKDLKKTIIFVSHDLDEALKIGNRIAILEGGRIVQCGTAEDILLRPADAYVAEFVKHMNPLNVLRGGSLMTPAASLRRNDNEVMLDRDGRVRVQLDSEGKPVGVTLDGKGGAMAVADRITGEVAARAEDVDIVVAPIDLRMRSAIALRSLSGNPIVLVDDLGRMAGLCGDDEIYRALLQQRRASGKRSPCVGANSSAPGSQPSASACSVDQGHSFGDASPERPVSVIAITLKSYATGSLREGRQGRQLDDEPVHPPDRRYAQKKTLVRENKIGRTSAGIGCAGEPIRAASIPPASSLSTKLGQNQHDPPLRLGAKGERLIDKVPHSHWETATFLAALRSDGIDAPCLFDGPINGERFRAYVLQFHVSTLKAGDIVILDNLGSHKGKAERKAISDVGARLVFLPKNSPT